MKEEKKKACNKFLNVIGGVLSGVFIIALIINCTLIVKAMIHEDKVPSIGGVYPLIVLTDSMNPEFYRGDLILCKQVDSHEIKTGDIISYFEKATLKSSIVSHRVIEIVQDEQGYKFKTKGDSNNMADEILVSGENVLGVYKNRFAYLGYVALFIQTKLGFSACVLVPIVFVILYEIRKQRKVTLALKNELEQLESFKQLEE